FQQWLQRLQRLILLDLVGGESCIEQADAVGGALVRERDVRRIVRRQRQRDAADVGLHRIDRARLDVDHELAGVARAENPGVQRIERAYALIRPAIDRQPSRRLFTRICERDRRAPEAGGLVGPVARLARCAPSGPASLFPFPACGGGSAGREGGEELLPPMSAAMFDGSICEYSATRLVSPENSIAFRNAISLRASGSCTASSSIGTSRSTLSSSSTSWREIRAFSAFSSSASRRFGCLISVARNRSCSRSPY